MDKLYVDLTGAKVSIVDSQWLGNCLNIRALELSMRIDPEKTNSIRFIQESGFDKLESIKRGDDLTLRDSPLKIPGEVGRVCVIENPVYVIWPYDFLENESDKKDIEKRLLIRKGIDCDLYVEKIYLDEEPKRTS